jgi:hypothetical protein
MRTKAMVVEISRPSAVALEQRLEGGQVGHRQRRSALRRRCGR